MLYLVKEQVYKLELSAKWRIYDEFHISLLEQDITRKGRINKFAKVPEFETGNDKEYEVEAI